MILPTMMKLIVTIIILLVCKVTSEPGPEVITHGSNEFTNRLYREVSKKPGNVVMSGVSLHTGLALLHQGAQGNTARELARVLQLSSVQSNINNDYRSALNSLKGDSLHIVTKLYPSDQIKVKSSFSDLAKQFFLTDIDKVNFSNPDQAAGKINSYVARHTNNKIREIISPDFIKPSTVLILINAIHFQAQWENPFTYINERGHFKVSSLQSVRATMMTQTDYFDFKSDNHLGAKILKMNYESKDGGDYYMLLVLPMRQHNLAELESKLVNINANNLLEELKPTYVRVTLPKFRIEKELDLKKTLVQMGIQESFTQSANFAKMSDIPVRISKVVQKTYIDVNENGTEAAAATAVGGESESMTPTPVNFQADHPFLFFVLKNKTILFSGRLQGPESEHTPSV